MRNEHSNPPVTILIPTYNQRHYLKQALESALEQDYANLEVIVGDDCSTDGTEHLVQEYLDGRVHYIRNQHRLGPGVNHAHLLANYAQGKYALILDHDDYLSQSDYISQAVRFFALRPAVSVVWANCMLLNEKTGKMRSTGRNLPIVTPGLEYFLNYQTRGYPNITSTLTALFDLDKVKESGFFEQFKLVQDTTLKLYLMLNGDVGFIQEVVGVYRIHPDSLSYRIHPEWDDMAILHLEELKGLVLSRKLASRAIMEQWIDRMIYNYMYWRCDTLSGQRQKQTAEIVLRKIRNRYPWAYKRLIKKFNLAKYQ